MAECSRIPDIDVGALFGGSPEDMQRVDSQIEHAAFVAGFMTVHGFPKQLPVGKHRRNLLLQLFELPMSAQRPLWKRNFAPENAHIYRGWWPLESGPQRNREGVDIGPDIFRATAERFSDDLLCEATPLPDASAVPPRWHATLVNYYQGMETLGFALLDSLSRSLNIDPEIFRGAFDDGISTLRLLRYPARRPCDLAADAEPDRYAMIDGERRELSARAHVDSGLLTILSPCEVRGLQAEGSDGSWHDVPADEDRLAVNFGGLMEYWTGGRIRATRHRVVSQEIERRSIPFFFEPRPDTRIEPLPLPSIEPFEPFLYGDHLWATTTKFPENYGLLHLRPHRAAYRAPMNL
jgi:isopenicillin N synthase-like dioxygenase